MMATLKTKPGELILEKFFKDYITVWYQARTVNAYTWIAARNEIELLKGLKNRERKQKHESLRTTDEDVLVVQTLPNDVPAPRDNRKQSKVPVVRPMSSKSDSPKRYSKVPQQQYSERNSEAKQSYTKKEVDFQRVLEENIMLKNKIAEMKEKIHSSRAEAYIEVTERDKQLESLKKALENSKAQVDDLTLRLSKSGGKADMADLSDSNRPTELGKRFSEIYDNEWSDAFDGISIEDEEKKVGILHGIVQISFSFCEQKLYDQTKQVRDELLGVTRATPSEFESDVYNADKTIRTANVHNFLKVIRKQIANETAENVAKEFISATLEYFVSGFGIDRKKIPETLRKYAKECAKHCWLMMVCDPPMALSEDKEGAKFDTNVYKPYTKSVRDMKNPVVKLRVWPAVHLHATGPLVAKGVAQPVEGKPK